VAAVEVRNLRKTYGHLVAVDDLSFTIDHGEVFALRGPNGSGKSTAVRSLVAAACGGGEQFSDRIGASSGEKQQVGT
jgi:ABC-type multidrug transport system ATPase subunit